MNLNNQKAFLKRFLSFVLVVAMMLNSVILYALPVLSVDIEAFVTLDGQRIDELYIADGEKLIVSASCDSEQDFLYSWQIRYGENPERWIDISKQNNEHIAVSNALVESLADENGVAYIRCVLNGDGEYVTNTVAVHLTGAPVLIDEEELFEEYAEDELIPSEKSVGSIGGAVIALLARPSSSVPEETPTEVVETPTEVVETPTEVAETPTEVAETPTEVVETPTDGAETPIEGVETPTDTQENPTEGAENPTEGVENPIDPEESPMAIGGVCAALMSAKEITDTQEAPIEETPVEDTPVEDTPVEDTPVEDTPVEDTPVEDTPVEDTPVEDTPVEDTPVEDTPVEDTPVEDTPVEDTPVEEDYPIENEAPVDESEKDPDSFTTHSIVINYLFDNNAIAFEPYGASVAHGSSFKESVYSPYVVGYDPFRRVDEAYVDAKTINFDIESVTEDITVNVIYRPALVKFSIHHHLQNLHNDEYSLTYDYITKSTALTGSLVPTGLAFTEEQLPGFKPLSYERLDVAADGSTVVEIRYDRNYYLVDFDMNGGYGTEPVYTRFGDSVGANIPIRHGYVFGGWELVSYDGHTPTEAQRNEFALAEGTVITVPAANLRYKARWITTQTTYTMVFWQENANDNGYTYWGHLEGLGALSGTLVDGRDMVSQVAGIDDELYFTFNENKTEKGVLVEGDGSTVVNVYYTRNYYKLTLKATGKCAIQANHTHGNSCYDYVCGFDHTHTDECVPMLDCTIPEHTEHTDECLICTLPEHTHSPECGCPLTEHTHSKSCWSVIGNSTNPPGNPPSNPVDGYVYRRNNSGTRYIYIAGKWYRYSGMASDGNIVDPTCNKEEHTHSDECACQIVEHSHGLTCYADSLHTHDENTCYKYSCGNVGHEHDDSCKRLHCGITANHTHTTNCNSSTRTNVVKEIYRKYGQSIEDIWPIVDGNGVVYDGGERWSPSDSSYYSNVLVYITYMPPDDFTLTSNVGSYTPYTMQYYLEMLPEDEVPAGMQSTTLDGKQYLLDNTIKARYNYVTKAEDFFDIVGFNQYKSNPSFSGNQIDINSTDESKLIVKFYYNRITDHYLNFSNNGEILDDKQVYGIPYGAKLTEYNFVPDYPSKLEPGAYTFGGWYSSPGCFAGTEVNWDTLTMPEGDLLLYAKWEPIKHKVNVWLDSSLTEKVSGEQIVDHGAFAHEPSSHVTNGNYVFQGWFYKDVVNGETVEKAFNFTGIPVMKDMDIYAKWSSHVSVDYRVNYVLRGTNTPIADPTVGSSIAGNNKTFEAKAGEDLYAGYQTGYYPLVNSHTITMSVDGTHEFTFEYVFVPSMPYMVRYVDAKTGAKLLPDKVIWDNSLSVVTETFERVDKTMPDAYQKRLVLSADDTDTDGDGIYDENVITFYYSFDEVHAYYKVVHYIHNISTNGYREYRSVEAVGEIGETYTVDALSMTGFYFNGERTLVDGVSAPVTGTTVSAKLGDEGMLIELYYDRLEYGYSVIYKNGATGEHIASKKEATALFGEQIVENALDLKKRGYTLSSEEVKSLNVSANVENNVIEFLYIESIASIKYQVVGPAGCGTLTRNSENVKAITGTPLGSAPIPAKGYKFVGWYTDVDCTIEADTSMIDADTLKLTPVKAADEIWKDNNEFFAKFVANETKLTIIKSGWDPFDTDQAFVFRLKGVASTETERIDLTFTVLGNGHTVIAALPVGEYTVTELAEWSWRYTPDEIEKSITLSVNAEDNKVIFSNSRTNQKWLDGNAIVKNVFE